MSSKTVTSMVTGIVVQIVVSAGARLEKEAPIVYLEAMKMEIPVVMPQDGRVKEILVAEGDMIEEGQAVARIE